jgi:hypothetical protein
MSRITILAAAAAVFAFAPAFAQESWCTDEHMKEMNQAVAAMKDEAKKKESMMHLKESKAAAGKNDAAGCLAHMRQAHTAMGM